MKPFHRYDWLGYVLVAGFLLIGCYTPEPEAPPVEAEDTTAGMPVQSVAFSPAPVDLAPGMDWLDAYRAPTVEEMFNNVATHIRFEPYSGLLRGATNTVIAGAGNSLDQAVLLATLLEDEVVAYRFAQGTLSDVQAAELIDSLYPHNLPPLPFSPDAFDLYQPLADMDLLSTAGPHYWLEVKTDANSDWLVLDPTFPGMAIGQSPVPAARTFGTPPRDLMQTLTLTLKQETGTGVQSLGSVGGMVSELALRPLSIVLEGTPVRAQAEAPAVQQAPSGGLGGALGGALTGGGQQQETPPETPTEPGPIIGVDFCGYVEAVGQVRSIPLTKVRLVDPSSSITRQWIEFTYQRPGAPPRTIERTLYEAASTADQQPPPYRRYTLTIAAGPVPEAVLHEQRAQFQEQGEVEKWIEAARHLQAASPSEEGVAQARTLEQTLGEAAGHLLALTFASESDSLARRLGASMGVVAVYNQPRIFIVSSEAIDGEEARTRMSLDLRLDEVRALPYPEVPRTAAPLFHRTRGIQESALEGLVVERFTGVAEAATTINVVGRVAQAEVPLWHLTAKNKADLSQVESLPPLEVRRIERALDEGYEVILPIEAVTLAGAARWGWWQVDPATGAFVGVMEGGQHQAMAEILDTYMSYGPNAEEQQGYYMGLLAGAVATHGLIIQGILKYGGLNTNIKQQMADILKQLACSVCPDVGAADYTVELGGAFFERESCFEAPMGFEVGVGPSANPFESYCSGFGGGVACSASFLLSNYGGPETEGAVEVGPDNYEITCEDD